MEVTKVMAVNPRSGEIESAYMVKDHFGKDHHAVRFPSMGFNAAYFSEKVVAWEPKN